MGHHREKAALWAYELGVMGSACMVAPCGTPVCVPGEPSGLLRPSFPWLRSKDGLNDSKICFSVSVDEKKGNFFKIRAIEMSGI